MLKSDFTCFFLFFFNVVTGIFKFHLLLTLYFFYSIVDLEDISTLIVILLVS
jgi:hypothetical protein